MRRQVQRRNERGASLVETALVLPLLLLLLVGIIDVGRAYYTYISIYNAAREGGRYAFNVLSSSGSPYYNVSISSGDEALIITHVRSETQGTVVDLSEDAGLATITVEANVTGDPDGSVRVTVNYAYDPIMLGIFGWDGELSTYVVFPVRSS